MSGQHVINERKRNEDLLATARMERNLARAERNNLQHQRDAAVIKATREQDKAKQAEATLARAGIECGCGQHHWVCVECVHKPQLAALENERELVEQLLDANPSMREFADKARAAMGEK